MQVLAVSSAGVVFKHLEDDVRPVTVAAWRLQATTVVLFPLFLWQWRAATPELVRDWMRAWHIMSASGICLAVHFGVWLVGLHYTTLPHALLFVTCTPILIALGCLVLRIHISRAEVISVAIGFGGMLLCEISTSGSKVRDRRLKKRCLPLMPTCNDQFGCRFHTAISHVKLRIKMYEPVQRCWCREIPPCLVICCPCWEH